MINTQHHNISKEELNAARRVINETRPEEVELMDDAEREAYNRAKQIIQEYYSKKRGPR